MTAGDGVNGPFTGKQIGDCLTVALGWELAYEEHGLGVYGKDAHFDVHINHEKMYFWDDPFFETLGRLTLHPALAALTAVRLAEDNSDALRQCLLLGGNS